MALKRWAGPESLGSQSENISSQAETWIDAAALEAEMGALRMDTREQLGVPWVQIAQSSEWLGGYALSRGGRTLWGQDWNSRRFSSGFTPYSWQRGRSPETTRVPEMSRGAAVSYFAREYGFHDVIPNMAELAFGGVRRWEFVFTKHDSWTIRATTPNREVILIRNL